MYSTRPSKKTRCVIHLIIPLIELLRVLLGRAPSATRKSYLANLRCHLVPFILPRLEAPRDTELGVALTTITPFAAAKDPYSGCEIRLT